MMTSEAPLDVDVGTFSAKHHGENGVLSIVFTGDADAASLSAIETFLLGVHALAVARSAKEVTLDLRAVSFMSSSCFTKLIGWVTRVRELPEPGRYKITIKSSQSSLWQRRSLHALQCFATELITIQS
jgi:hypothetical protein